MSNSHSHRRWDRLTARVAVLSLDDRFWLSLAVAMGLCVHLVYLVTHPYPAYGAGLYLAIAETIANQGYTLPASVPGYTAGGVPLAYPPVAFYVAAVARELTGVGPFTYSRLVPGLLVTAALVPYYFTAKRLLDSPRKAGVATLVLAGTPSVLQWHLSAGGIVRGLAFLLVLSGLAVGVRLFDTEDPRWLLPATALFGLTVLTHPVYTVFFGLTYLLLFAARSRTARGLCYGAVVAGGGFLLASPWLWHVHTTHGIETLLAAAGTHGGLVGGAERILSEFVYPVDADVEAAFFLAAYTGAAVALVRRRWLLPAWLFIAGFVIGKPRFLFVPGSMLTAWLVFEYGVPAVRAWTQASRLHRNRRRVAELAAVGLVLVAAVASGTAFAAGAVDTHAGDPSQPAFVDADDEAAMTWVERETPRTARFVVLGDAAEWFPLVTDRPILVGPWGVEWTTPEQYETQLTRYEEISTCDTAACISLHLEAADVSPTHLYVPTGHYTVRGDSYEQPPSMRATLRASDRYEIVHETEGAMVVRVREPDER
ncbi:ArnT family glycosyltransferase [Halorarius litoreus]|uniref:ArnT family glycosyltransferase n=1 Tax=Halorarius litoreus TaxID=2962676 RepID=UPI0020CBF9E6|nr:glycosyltransferase family 39 protein [Halorarius litoreus]